MRAGRRSLTIIALVFLICAFAGCSDRGQEAKPKPKRLIVTSDSILSTMAASLVPSASYTVAAIVPPGQCPGHYDMKLSDIERIKRADLLVSFEEMPFVEGAAGADRGRHIVIRAAGRNFMAPDSYVYGLNVLADRLCESFPDDAGTIVRLKEEAVRSVNGHAASLIGRIRDAGLAGKPVIASSLQKQTLEWMGFRVVGEYGRPESMSAHRVVHLVRAGKKEHAIFVADNLQSGPDTGRGVADSLGIPHIVLSNFPSEKGYLATLGENAEILLAALKGHKGTMTRGAAHE